MREEIADVKGPNISGFEPAAGVSVIACPKCDARFTFLRSAAPYIDECGFESYRLECTQCGAPLAGVVDPFDDTLLLSALAA